MELGVNGSEVRLHGGESARVELKAAAMLPEVPDPKFHNLRYDEKPYWHVERARIPGTREVPVELIVNGLPVATKNLPADGRVHDLEFNVPIKKSSWIAVRILASSHTNPIFALVGDKPVRASRRSAEWLLAAVNQCWTQKAPRTRDSDKEQARKAYDHAREVYKQRIAESSE